MGRRDRERRERIQRGEEQARAVLNNPVSREAMKFASRRNVVDQLQRASTEDQIGVLDATVATRRPKKLREAIIKKAPGQMDSAIKKFKREGKKITVDSLCEEIKSIPGFLSMCEKVGLSLEWFENLARERMKVNGL